LIVFVVTLIWFYFADHGPRKRLAKRQQRSQFLKFMNQVNWRGDISQILIMR